MHHALNKIKQMKFGKVEIIKINSIGIFITIENNIIEEKIETNRTNQWWKNGLFE